MTSSFNHIIRVLTCSKSFPSVSYSAQEPALPLYLADRYGLNSSKVGLVLLAGVIPTLFCESLSRLAIVRSMI